MKGVSLTTGVSVTPLRLCASEAEASNAFKVVDGKVYTVLENEQKNKGPSQQDLQETVVLLDGDEPHYMSFLSCTVQNGLSYTTQLTENDPLLSIHYEKEVDFGYEPDDGSGDDPVYMEFLASTVQKGTSYITKHEENGSLLHLHYENVDECGYEADDGNSDDPYYFMFLASTVQKGTSYMTRHEENGSLLVIDYEGEDSLGLVEYYRKDQDEDYLVCLQTSNYGFKASFPGSHMDGCSDSEDVEVIQNKYSIAGERYPDCFVPSKEYLSLDETNKFCGQSMQSPFRKKIITILKRPYDQSEYEKLLKGVKVRLPVERNMELRNGRDVAYSANRKGKSLLDHHKDLKDKLKEAQANKRKRLNILAGFSFWLQHLTQAGVFKPWTDTACLDILPASR